MNFFKSVFSDDPTHPESPESTASPSSEPVSRDPTTIITDPTNSPWSFGGLIKTLTTKSESVIDTYRRDIEELRSGLRKESALIRGIASHAVKDLPASFEMGASAAQESLESVGQAIDDIGASVWKSTARIISRRKGSAFGSDKKNEKNLNLKRYSRFDMQVNVIQSDLNTYCIEPEDNSDYEEWRRGLFDLGDKQAEIDVLISENKVVREIYDEVVPSRVDKESFFSRYFYKLHKLRKAEEARALLVKRAISGEEDDLSWDFEDDDDNVDSGRSSGSDGNVDESLGGDNKLNKGEEKVEAKRDSDVSVISSRQSLLPEEDDLGWDEIEEIGESKGEAAVAGTSRIDLRQRWRAAEDEEDLSWDIDDEDDDESHKQ